MPGFVFRKNLDGSAHVPSLVYKIGANAVTFTIGDPVRVDTDGFCALADAITDGIAGIVVQVVNKDGKALTPDTGTLHDYTMGAANETTTTQQYKVGFIPALPNYLFYNDADDDLTATMEFQFFNITAGSAQIDMATATDTPYEQFRLIERDPDGDADASKGLFQITESQFGTTGLGPVA